MSKKENPSENFDYVILNRDARRASKNRKLIIILLIIILLVLLLGGAAYAFVSLIQYNSFRAVVEKQGDNLFSLSYSPRFDNPSSALSFGGPRYMDNVTFIDIYNNLDAITETEGTYRKNEVQYMAITFYFKNVTETTYKYREMMMVESATKGIDEAMRMAIIRNGEITIYGKLSPEDQVEEVVPGENFSKSKLPNDPVWMCEPFYSDFYAFYNTGLAISPGDVVKYTYIFWIEGNDKQCTDDILGGTVRMELQFSQWFD
ncbi:MAG: hypothetical protein LBE09_05965 [Christensenellaceae bacterium]|nr:hypothetical protein [Christensenellaceae bacterium]